MKLVEASNEFIINEHEYFYNLNSPSYHPTSIQAYIPKLMPEFSMGVPTPAKAALSASIFCNDIKCKPKPVTIMTTQNYVTLTKPENLSPSYYSTSKGGKMIKQQKHILEVGSRDIRQMHFIEDK